MGFKPGLTQYAGLTWSPTLVPGFHWFGVTPCKTQESLHYQSELRSQRVGIPSAIPGYPKPALRIPGSGTNLEVSVFSGDSCPAGGNPRFFLLDIRLFDMVPGTRVGILLLLLTSQRFDDGRFRDDVTVTDSRKYLADSYPGITITISPAGFRTRVGHRGPSRRRVSSFVP
eukprot:767022-Rhodomonas_salina.1